jgi:signal transduction histidine kinase
MQEISNLNFRSELDTLTAIRDELKLKAHLARADMRDELDKLEQRFRRLEERLPRDVAHVKAPLEAIGQDAKDLIHELKVGYEDLRGRFS